MLNAINENKTFCEACQKGKSHKLLFLSSNSEIHEPFELIYNGLWGASPVTTRNGYKYYVNFVGAKS